MQISYAYHYLARAIQSLQNSHGKEHMEAIKCINTSLQPGFQQAIQQQCVPLPRFAVDVMPDPRVTAHSQLTAHILINGWQHKHTPLIQKQTG